MTAKLFEAALRITALWSVKAVEFDEAGKVLTVLIALLAHWRTCVMRPKVEPMKEVAALVRRHLEGIMAWAQTRHNSFLEAINGLFPSRLAPRSRLHAPVRHQDGHLPARRQARFHAIFWYLERRGVRYQSCAQLPLG